MGKRVVFRAQRMAGGGGGALTLKIKQPDGFIRHSRELQFGPRELWSTLWASIAGDGEDLHFTEKEGVGGVSLNGSLFRKGRSSRG